jgi:hypothetical protein
MGQGAQAKANRENIFAVFCGLLPTVDPRQVRSGTGSDFRPFSTRGFLANLAGMAAFWRLKTSSYQKPK